MLSTEFTLAVAVFSLLVGIFALISCIRLANYVGRVVIPRAKKADVAALSAELTDLRDAYESLLASHKKLRARITMRQHRANGKDPDTDVPDWRTDPQGYKRAMRHKHLR